MKRSLGLLLLVCLLPLSVRAQGAQWTLIYWSPADTDLEEDMIGDLMEMQIVGSTQDVNIVVEMDRVPGYDDTYGSWDDTRRFLVKKGTPGAPASGDFAIDREGYIASLEEADPEELGMAPEDVDQMIADARNASDEEFESMILENRAPVIGADPQMLQQTSIESVGEGESNAAQLSDFIIWSVENYPAEHYMIVISDHGGGWQGIAFDDTSGGDPLTMTELTEALATATKATGIDKFDLIAFDACLMADLEVFKILEPFARYTIAAQEPIPGAGWEYVTPLTALTKNPGMGVEEFGKIVVDSFIDYYTNAMAGYDNFDLHLIDLSQTDAVISALSNVVAIVDKDPATYIEAIGFARQQAYAADNDDPQFANLDLLDFMTKLQSYSDDEALNEAAQGVIDAVSTMRVYGAHSAPIVANGIAIYFPANLDDYEGYEGNVNYPREVGEIMSDWLHLLTTFYGTAAEVYVPESTGLNISITNVVPADYSASIYDPPVILFDTDGTGIVDMQFYAALEIEEGEHVIVDASALEDAGITEEGEPLPPFPEGPSSTEFQWNVETPLVIDAQGNSEIVAFISDPNNPDQVTVNGIYHPRSGEATDADAIFDLETYQMVALFSVQSSDVGSALGQIRPRPGDTFEPYRMILTTGGEIVLDPSGTELVIGSQPLSFQFVPAPDGNYELTIWIEDIAGNHVQDTTTFEIDNSELDTNWRAFKDISVGLSFLYPWDWTDASQVVYEDESYSLELDNVEETQSIYVTTFDEDFGATSLDDLIANAEATIDDMGGTAGEAEIVEAGFEGEYEAAVIPYSYQDDETGDDRLAWSILLYDEDNALGYQIDVDVLAEDEAVGSDLVSYITGSLYIDAPIDTSGGADEEE